jgi:hypothetical protein
MRQAKQSKPKGGIASADQEVDLFADGQKHDRQSVELSKSAACGGLPL